MTATFAAAKVPQATSTQCLRSVEAIPDISHRFDHVRSELGTEPPDAHVHDVAPGIERVPPHIGEEALTRADVAVPAHQILEQEELALAEGNGTVARVGDPARQIEAHPSHAKHPLIGTRGRLSQ